MVGKDEVELVLIGDLIARIIAQTCRQSGLSIVYTELLDFGGDEIYFKSEPELVGKTFGETLVEYEDSTVIGLFTAGNISRLNPPMDTRLEAGDRIIAISADDDTIKLAHLKDLNLNENAVITLAEVKPAPEKTLILGWNWRAPVIIKELDNYVAPGSMIDVVADYQEGEADIKRLCKGVKNQKISYHIGDTTDRQILDELAIDQYQHVILLCYSEVLDVQEADARTCWTSATATLQRSPRQTTSSSAKN